MAVCFDGGDGGVALLRLAPPFGILSLLLTLTSPRGAPLGLPIQPKRILYILILPGLFTFVTLPCLKVLSQPRSALFRLFLPDLFRLFLSMVQQKITRS
ncbi:hypothetical protein QVD17_39175 [Tagetes erecta]|uniref:Uncharacterized protein n=1 Tax=Tagetes erecta TaxID=13708 RepID=A0AAD8JPS2_TARER|nr:hypothetical protein QVD17_39175 [Tagetes erecta]